MPKYDIACTDCEYVASDKLKRMAVAKMMQHWTNCGADMLSKKVEALRKGQK